MSVLAALGSNHATVAVALLGVALALWLAWRMPTAAFLVAVLALAIRPQVVTGGPAVGYGWGLHQTLFLLALLANALRYGVRALPNWPLVALGLILGLGVLLGELHPKLTYDAMLASLAMFALPFCFAQVVLAPGSRRVAALVIALTPLASVLAGALLGALGFAAGFDHDSSGLIYRLTGAAGNAAVFATLAFAGFAVAVHEATRPGRPYALYLSVINLVLVILSGTRMAMLASGIFLVVYAMLSPSLRNLRRGRPAYRWFGLGALAAALFFYWPSLQHRLFGGGLVDLSGRDQLWSFYLREFRFSPIFGRGFGSGMVAGHDWFTSMPLPTPHNEYLHLLVVGGILGFLLYAGALVLWYRQLLRLASPNDRRFLLALIPAFAVYALTENLLVYATALALYAYLGVLLTGASRRAARSTSSSGRHPELSAAHKAFLPQARRAMRRSLRIFGRRPGAGGRASSD